VPQASKRPLNPLGEALTRLLEARSLTDADFARKAGISHALLSIVKRRKPTRLPKGVNLKKWAHALSLSDKEAAMLQEAAELAWSPVGIQELVAKLKR
jgi:transcriptional regulator with XRE-family HTH domain